jgi:hypothetical protein
LTTSRAATSDGPSAPIVVLLLFAASFTPLSHALWSGLAPIDSYNSIWAEAFGAALRRGEFPPRWLPEGFHGLGASSFYFYPPLAFYVAAVFDGLTGGLLSAEQLTAWACFVMTFAGSLGMYAWLRPQTSGWTALVAGAVYAVTPYHLLDIFARGALGEVAVHAVLPFLALSMQRAARSVAWIAPLALCLAGVILGHVAVALPIGLIAAPAFALWLIARAAPQERLAATARLAAGAILGLGVAASYLAPALGLQAASSMNFMWGPAGSAADPASWTLLNSARWPSPPLAKGMAWLGWTYGAAALVVMLLPGRAAGPRAAMARPWALVCLVAIVAYAFPAAWHGPLSSILNKMQFPFRMLVMVEFALVSAVCLALTGQRRRWGLVLVGLIGAALYVPYRHDVGSAFERAEDYPANADATIVERIRHGRLPEEHLPAAFFYDPKIMVSRVYLDGYERLPLVRTIDPAARVLAASQYPDGSLAVRLEAPAATRVVVRRFYFPAWRADVVRPGKDPQVPTSSTGPSRILTFTALPGQHVYRLHIVRTPIEKLGDGIALAALLAVLLLTLTALPNAARRLQDRFRAFKRASGLDNRHKDSI